MIAPPMLGDETECAPMQREGEAQSPRRAAERERRMMAQSAERWLRTRGWLRKWSAMAQSEERDALNEDSMPREKSVKLMKSVCSE